MISRDKQAAAPRGCPMRNYTLGILIGLKDLVTNIKTIEVRFWCHWVVRLGKESPKEKLFKTANR